MTLYKIHEECIDCAVPASYKEEHCTCNGFVRALYMLKCLSLDDVWSAHSSVNPLVHDVPVDLGEHLIDLSLLGHHDWPLAVRRACEHLHSQSAGAHVSGEPNPTFPVIHDPVGLKFAIFRTALDDHCWRGLLHEAGELLHGDLHILLADGTRRWALPHARVALEARRLELSVESLDDQLTHNGTLRRGSSRARDCLLVKLLNVGIGDIILATTTSTESYTTLDPSGWLRRCDKGQILHEAKAQSSNEQASEQARRVSHGASARSTSSSKLPKKL